MLVITAACLTFFIGLAHSVLGEKYLVSRLLRRDNLPKLFGDDWFTKRLIRFAWHLTTIAWWGIAAVFWLLASPQVDLIKSLLGIFVVMFAVSGLVALVFSKGKHLSWLVFFAISGLSLFCVY